MDFLATADKTENYDLQVSGPDSTTVLGLS